MVTIELTPKEAIILQELVSTMTGGMMYRYPSDAAFWTLEGLQWDLENLNPLSSKVFEAKRKVLLELFGEEYVEKVMNLGPSVIKPIKDYQCKVVEE